MGKRPSLKLVRTISASTLEAAKGAPSLSTRLVKGLMLRRQRPHPSDWSDSDSSLDSEDFDDTLQHFGHTWTDASAGGTDSKPKGSRKKQEKGLQSQRRKRGSMTPFEVEQAQYLAEKDLRDSFTGNPRLLWLHERTG